MHTRILASQVGSTLATLSQLEKTCPGLPTTAAFVPALCTWNSPPPPIAPTVYSIAWVIFPLFTTGYRNAFDNLRRPFHGSSEDHLPPAQTPSGANALRLSIICPSRLASSRLVSPLRQHRASLSAPRGRTLGPEIWHGTSWLVVLSELL